MERCVRAPFFMTISVMLLLVVGGAPSTYGHDLTPISVSAFAPEASTVLARATGSFEAAGLDVNVNLIPGSTEQMRGLSNGTYDLAYTAFDNVLAWSGREGAEIIAVSSLDGDVSSLQVYVRPEIQEWADLRGRALAVDAPDTAFALVLRRILLAHGVDLANGDYTPVPLGGAPARLQSMLKGDTYAGILSADLYAQAESAGMHSFGDQHEVLPEYPGGVIAVRRDWAEANRDALMSFVKAWREAGESTQTDSDSAAQLVANELGQPVETARAQLPTRFNRGELNLVGLQSVLDLRNQFGYALPMGPDLGTYVDTSFWQATLGG